MCVCVCVSAKNTAVCCLTARKSPRNSSLPLGEYWVVTPTHARWLARETVECIESRICQLLLKTRGSSEAVLEQEDISKVVQCFSYSIASFVPLVFKHNRPNLDSIHFHWGGKSLANQLVGVTTQYSFISVRAGAMYNVHLNCMCTTSISSHRILAVI